jgi:hypothetical protein
MVWALRWFAMDFGAGLVAILAQLFTNYQSNINSKCYSDGIQMGISSIKQCLLGPRMKNEVIQGQWFDSDGIQMSIYPSNSVHNFIFG